ncbi:uncharacterized protein LY79DRAFT_358180 [Colletotrichum navitas]|uniref:Uncharacterized protein n=1 Tax=Colletotrichum navitas TaxID=681940 RepID=A0AAD8PR67_9PEZI|nr:uncharacterized protein LY79DRAFT_358180 [Colletotrichum navitas]KAK1579183.1 hypothetical protein LY79DRAFT_358180 [Colletotrichum navitas]
MSEHGGQEPRQKERGRERERERERKPPGFARSASVACRDVCADSMPYPRSRRLPCAIAIWMTGEQSGLFFPFSFLVFPSNRCCCCCCCKQTAQGCGIRPRGTGQRAARRADPGAAGWRPRGMDRGWGVMDWWNVIYWGFGRFAVVVVVVVVVVMSFPPPPFSSPLELESLGGLGCGGRTGEACWGNEPRGPFWEGIDANLALGCSPQYAVRTLCV